MRYDQCTRVDQALDIVLEALTRYVKEKLIQISGRFVFTRLYFIIYKSIHLLFNENHFSATLFYIVKNKDRPLLLNDITVKRRIITTLLTGMDFHNYDETMMRNGCLTLCQLRIPQDVVSLNKFITNLIIKN